MTSEALHVHGEFVFRCWLAGRLLWERSFPNVVATVGKNLAFNTFLNGSGYTVTGPYIGLIDGAGFTGTAATDTMTSHPGWNEASYYSLRQTCIWAPANNGSIETAGALTFSFTGNGSVQGAFLNYGSGALNTVGNTGGVLWSAGSFVGGPVAVASGATLQVFYTASM